MDWLYPRKRRVFRVTDLSSNLDLRESPGTFWMRVQPRRWIAVSADDRSDRKKMEEDLKALLQKGDASPGPRELADATGDATDAEASQQDDGHGRGAA